ncbi:MAG: glycosyltransferase [Bacteroidota bacterium]
MEVSQKRLTRVDGSHDQPKRILFTPASNILAHVGRCVMLARELQKRGYDIILAGTPKFLHDPALVRRGEFEIYTIADYEAQEGLKILRKVRKVPARQILNEHIQAEVKMLDQLQPDVVVNDFRLTLYLSARRQGIPIISLLGGRWMYQYAARPFKAPRTHPMYPLLKRFIGERGTDAVVPIFQRWALRYKMRPYYHLSKHYGLEPKKELWDLLVGEYNLILDTELLGPMSHLPDNFCRVGPIAWTPKIPLPDWTRTVNRTQPVIYLTMGSTGHADLFKQMIETLAHADYTIIMTTGGQRQIPNEHLPNNFYVANYLPGEQIMELADLVIFHGGAGTGYQAIATGTPSIIIATHLEQEFVGEVVEEHGAGIFLTMNQVLANPSVMRTSIATILEHIDLYRSHMKKLQADFLRYDPVRTAADCVEEFMKRLP